MYLICHFNFFYIYLDELDIFEFEFLYWPVIRLNFQQILDKTIQILTELEERLHFHAAESFIPNLGVLCVHEKSDRFCMFLQDGAQEEQHSKTKQESAWLFRLWYTFDHKYPSCTRLYNTRKFCLSLLLMLQSQKSVPAAASPFVPFVSYKSPS